MNIIQSTSRKSKHIIIAIYIVLMSVQLIALEGYGVSPIKVVLMSIAPILIVYL